MCLSYVRQRNSRSRLSASRQLFEILCHKYDAFQKLREFVSCFGIRKSEVQPNAPAMWYNLLGDSGNGRSRGGNSGFGQFAGTATNIADLIQRSHTSCALSSRINERKVSPIHFVSLLFTINSGHR